MSMKMKITRCSIIQSFLWNCCFVFFVANLKWHQFSSKYFLNTHHYWLGAFKLMENSQGPRALRLWFSFRNKGYCYSWLFGKKFHITQSRISQTFLVMLINCSTYWKKKKLPVPTQHYLIGILKIKTWKYKYIWASTANNSYDKASLKWLVLVFVHCQHLWYCRYFVKETLILKS